MPGDIPTSRAAHLRARLQTLTDHGPRSDGHFVLYWMQQARRLHWNHSLQHAVYRAREHNVPLLIVEDLFLDQPWTQQRHFHFALQGMRDHRAALADRRDVAYLPWIERQKGQLARAFPRLMTSAVEVVTDDVPCGVPTRLIADLSQWAEELGVRATAVDSNGLMPIRLLDAPKPTAAVYRRYLHRHAHAALEAAPVADPLHGQIANQGFKNTWIGQAIAELPRADDLLDHPERLADLPIDTSVAPIQGRGGRRAGLSELQHFLSERLEHYENHRNDPSRPVTSGLSPYLHWGHLSAYEIALAALEQDPDWDPARLPEKGGKRTGFWPVASTIESFLDELLTWRELGYHTCQLVTNYDRYESLPNWAQETLATHQSDRREHLYDLDAFDRSETHDELWNAAQRELVQEGVIHNYLRMLWAKKIIEWTPDPQSALKIMIELNNRYGLDGRNPNSYSGIFWSLGRYDRPWQERAVFGKIRYMTSRNTAKKVNVRDYLVRFGASAAGS